MPYHIESDHESCNGFAVVKDSDAEVMGCHRNEDQASRQMAALYAAEDDAAAKDYDEPTHTMPDGTVMAGASHPRADADAPVEDQVKGSSINEPGSASNKSGDIAINEATETALQNKADAHNEQMTEDDRPSWTRVSVGALRSVYRRGSGAYSTSHRPGIGRAQWSMARVNAFLYLARTGRPENAKYVGDNDLLNSDHPRYSKQERAVSHTPTDAMVQEARRGLDWRQEFNRGGTEVGVARARDIANRRPLSHETVGRMASFFARHEVDKEGQGFTPDQDGYPSAGRIAWALWGGDPGKAFADAIMREEQDDDPMPNRTAALQILAQSIYIV